MEIKCHYKIKLVSLSYDDYLRNIIIKKVKVITFA